MIYCKVYKQNNVMFIVFVIVNKQMVNVNNWVAVNIAKRNIVFQELIKMFISDTIILCQATE